jgi:hypothetical protein
MTACAKSTQLRRDPWRISSFTGSGEGTIMLAPLMALSGHEPPHRQLQYVRAAARAVFGDDETAADEQ